jgi:flagellar biosynthesis chaperone FliJ
MQRFRFRLERVLRLKRQRERQVELRQQQAAAGLEAARLAALSIQAMIEQQMIGAVGRGGQAMALDSWISRSQYLAQLERSLDAAQAQVRAAEGRLREVNTERATVHAEVGAIEQRRRDQWDEYRHDAQRSAQEQIDDLSLRNWLLARAAEDSVMAKDMEQAQS